MLVALAEFTGVGAPQMAKVQEQKRHIGKPDEFYWCDEIHREPGYLVLRYEVVKPGRIFDIEIPAGSLTIAHYRENRGHVVWEMYDPQRALIGHLFHICMPPEIGPTHVEYLDLLVDVWVSPEGEVRVLDEDEFETAREQGQIGKEQAALVHCELQYLKTSHREVIIELWRPEEDLPARR